MTDVPISTRLSPALHPDALATLEPALNVQGTLGHGAYAEAREAMGTAYNTLRAIQEAEDAVQAAETAPAMRRQLPSGQSLYVGDVRMSADGRLRRYSSADEQFAAAADAAIARALPTIDRRRANLLRTVEALETRVAEALRPQQPVAVQQEIRSHVRTMAKGDRVAFLQVAARAGERETVGAVLAAPPYLAGLDADGVALVRDIAAAALAPQDHAQLAALRRAIVAVEGAGAALVGRMPTLEKYRNSKRAEVGRRVAALGGRAA
jgi:hypothetical protein